MNMPINVIPCDVVMPSFGESISELVRDNATFIIALLVIELLIAAIVTIAIVSRKKDKQQKLNEYIENAKDEENDL